jgi:DNA-binding IclR family transcriptional regulator
MSYLIDVLDASLRLLSHIAEHPGRGVSELAADMGLNKSRVFRMLHTLEAHRYVIHDERTDGYSLGPQAFVLGVAASEQNALVRCAQRHMLALCQAINETVILRVREGMESVCVARFETTHELRAVSNIGNRRKLGPGASGKVLLAFAPEMVRNEFMAEARRDGVSEPEIAALRAQLERVSAQGYAITKGDLVSGTMALSTPVRDASGYAVAALSISGPQSRLREMAQAPLLDRLRACSHAISTELGGDVRSDHGALMRPVRGRA